MKILTNITRPVALFLLLAGITMASCNKNIPDPTPINYPTPTGSSIGELLNDPNFSYLQAAVTRVGLMAPLLDKNTKFTVFAPDNNAFNNLFTALGLPANIATVGALPIASLTAILQYHVVPGSVLSSTMIPESYPNTNMPTLLAASGTNPLLKFVNFPSRRGASAFVDNVPVAAANIVAANGVVHRMAGVIMPPSTNTLAQGLSADTSMTFLMAAVTRADAGMPNGSKFSQLLSTPSPYANFTVFAPNNNAFRALYRAFGVPEQASSINLFTVNTAVSIVAYHLHIAGVTTTATGASPQLIRVFSPNLPTTPTQATSFLSVLSPTAPRLTVNASQGVKGTGNATYSAIIGTDRHFLNGVYHIINQVLIPQ